MQSTKSLFSLRSLCSFVANQIGGIQHEASDWPVGRAKNQKGRVSGPALLTENNVKIFSSPKAALRTTLDTHSETPHFALSTLTPYPIPLNPKVTRSW